MLSLDNIVSNKNENKDTTGRSSSERNNWPFRMLILGPSGSGKTNTLLHLINNLHPIDKIYLYAKDIHEPKYEYLINKIEQAGIKNLNDPHAFIQYSDDMNDVLDDINNYNKNRDKKVLIVFDDMTADIEYNKNFKRIIKELFYRTRKINVSIVFITQSYFRALKDADGFDDDGSDTTPYDTPYTSDDGDDEDDIKNNKKNMIIYCLNIFN